MKPLVDAHCHLDLYPDWESLAEECEANRVYTLAVTTTPRAWPKNNEVFASKKYVRAALGLHPQLVGEHWREFDLWERYLSDARYVGEVGVDAGPRFYRSLERQKDVFERILQACAQAGGKILTVHSVRSASIVLDMIEEHLPKDRGAVIMHWFTGTQSEARRAVELGCYFSVNEQMLRSANGAKLVRLVPIDRLLTETDGPFVQANGAPLRPIDVRRLHPALAAAIAVKADELPQLISKNLKALLA